jgi:site-specific DNA recombinase
MDFSKIIEVFDSHGVSFVSVTQQFNTTTSMGRLTLNVLLSFAQFEREVTGERIRDKVAASKKKGIWMGSFVPQGYDHVDRRLVVNPIEAKTVRRIFQEYLRLGSVSELKTYLGSKQIHSKIRSNVTGQTSGGKEYSRGALYHLLKNRIYIGEIVHHGKSYPGQHEAIIPQDLWNKVAARLEKNNRHTGWGSLIQRQACSLASCSIAMVPDSRQHMLSRTQSGIATTLRRPWSGRLASNPQLLGFRPKSWSNSSNRK